VASKLVEAFCHGPEGATGQRGWLTAGLQSALERAPAELPEPSGCPAVPSEPGCASAAARAWGLTFPAFVTAKIALPI